MALAAPQWWLQALVGGGSVFAFRRLHETLPHSRNFILARSLRL
jgi:hypothetical protein